VHGDRTFGAHRLLDQLPKHYLLDLDLTTAPGCGLMEQSSKDLLYELCLKEGPSFARTVALQLKVQQLRRQEAARLHFSAEVVKQLAEKLQVSLSACVLCCALRTCEMSMPLEGHSYVQCWQRGQENHAAAEYAAYKCASASWHCTIVLYPTWAWETDTETDTGVFYGLQSQRRLDGTVPQVPDYPPKVRLSPKECGMFAPTSCAYYKEHFISGNKDLLRYQQGFLSTIADEEGCYAMDHSHKTADKVRDANGNKAFEGLATCMTSKDQVAFCVPVSSTSLDELYQHFCDVLARCKALGLPVSGGHLACLAPVLGNLCLTCSLLQEPKRVYTDDPVKMRAKVQATWKAADVLADAMHVMQRYLRSMVTGHVLVGECYRCHQPCPPACLHHRPHVPTCITCLMCLPASHPSCACPACLHHCLPACRPIAELLPCWSC
jgi:hypothetical protein